MISTTNHCDQDFRRLRRSGASKVGDYIDHGVVLLMTMGTNALPNLKSPPVTIPLHPGDQFQLTFAPLSLDAVYQQADDGTNGAIVVMSGMVRNNTAGQAVTYLEYQAYEPMALRVFQQVAAEVRQQWPDVTHVVIAHRTGKLEIGEISVLIAVGAPHRGEAFAACQYTIDTVKHRAPIWKKEIWQNGSSTWVNIGDCERIESIGL
jgi:molybdopterin synthase catalytic subunit